MEAEEKEVAGWEEAVAEEGVAREGWAAVAAEGLEAAG